MAVTLPYTFTSGTTIRSSEVNANFDSLNNRTQWVTPEMFGAVGDGVTDDTVAVQAAIDAVTGVVDDPNAGGVVRLGSGIYITSGISLPTRVSLVGQGVSTTVIKLKAGSNTDVISIPATSAYNFLRDLSVDGNKANNTAGNGLTWDTTSLTDNGSSEVTTKQSRALYSFKYTYLDNVVFNNCAENGIYRPISNYIVFGKNIVCAFNNLDGIYDAGYNSHFTDLNLLNNGRCGLYVTGSNNRYHNAEINWNGHTDGTKGQLGVEGAYTSRNVFAQIQIEDGWTHGVYCDDPTGGNMYIGIVSDRNGYDSATGSGYSPTASSRVHSGFYILSAKSSFIGCYAGSYAAKLSDGYYATEYPYSLAGADRQVGTFDIKYQPGVFNSPPQGNYETSTGDISGPHISLVTDLVYPSLQYKDGAEVKSQLVGSTTGASFYDGLGDFVFRRSLNPSGTGDDIARIKHSGGFSLPLLPTYANNTEAIAGGLYAGDLYKTSTGEVRIRY